MRTLPRIVLPTDESRSPGATLPKMSPSEGGCAGVRGICYSSVPPDFRISLFSHPTNHPILVCRQQFPQLPETSCSRLVRTTAKRMGSFAITFQPTQQTKIQFPMIHFYNNPTGTGPPGSADPPGQPPGNPSRCGPRGAEPPDHGDPNHRPGSPPDPLDASCAGGRREREQFLHG